MKPNPQKLFRNFPLFLCINLVTFTSMALANQDISVNKLGQMPLGTKKGQKGNNNPFEWSINLQQSSRWRKQALVGFDNNAKWRTNSILIIHNKTIVYERYENGFNKEKPHQLWSVSKSITSALVGLRLKQLKLNESVYASQLGPLLREEDKKNIRIRDLLQMSSGIKWNEFYENNPFQSHVVKMLYLSAQKNMPLFTASQEMKDYPGHTFNYSSGETNLLIGILKYTFEKEEDFLTFPWDGLFIPLGMKNITWERDGGRHFVGSSYLYMTPRDLAKIGQLYLNKGRWQGQQILTENYVYNSFRPSPSSCQNNRKRSNSFSYGYHWWLNFKCPEKSKHTHKKLSKIPENLILALGHHGQIMALFPEHNLIAIRTGADKKQRFDRKKWLESIYETVLTLKENK